jgi:hypothetical protein
MEVPRHAEAARGGVLIVFQVCIVAIGYHGRSDCSSP